MASLRDMRSVLKSCGWWTFLRHVYQQTNDDGIFVWASALAYSWLFSIFPFLILLLSLVPYLPLRARDNAKHVVTEAITSMLGKEASTINDNIDKVINKPRTGWLWIGLVVSLWVASGGMSMTMAALDKCYEVKKSRPFIKQRVIAMLITIGVTLCVVVIIILMPIGEAVGSWGLSHGVLSVPVRMAFDVARYVIALCFSFVVLGIIYHFGPNTKQRFQIISPGAIFSAVVWFVLNGLFRVYIDRYARYDQTYGTVGGAAILLLFFYIDGLVLLIGAEINSEIDFERLGVVEKPGDGSITVKESSEVPTMAKEL